MIGITQPWHRQQGTKGLKGRLYVLGILVVIGLLVYGVGFSDAILSPYIANQRLIKVLAVLLVGFAIGTSSLVFQTLTNNRILTPGVIGLDQLYMLLQGVTLFIWGANQVQELGDIGSFIVCTLLMIIFSVLLFRLLFNNGLQQLYYILLVGVVSGLFFKSLYSFVMALLDPDAFSILQYKMFADFSMLAYPLLGCAAVVIIGVTLWAWPLLPYLDALVLGDITALSLGVDVGRIQEHAFIAVAALVAVSTALVGPITFLGLMTVNITYLILPTYRHRYLLLGSIGVTVLTLCMGLLAVERIFNMAANLTVVINGIGGCYFIWLLLRKDR